MLRVISWMARERERRWEEAWREGLNCSCSGLGDVDVPGVNCAC
jgi:hypothetical protein